jgi:hypothetical protein
MHTGIAVHFRMSDPPVRELNRASLYSLPDL